MKDGMDYSKLGLNPKDLKKYKKMIAELKKSKEVNKEPKKLYGNYKKLQDLYENKGLKSLEFYNQIIAYIKKLLNKYLYQKQFSEDNINDCFVLLYEKIEKNYDSNKGCLGTFIHTCVRNYCTKINYHLVNYQNPISLDFEYINREDLNKSYFDLLEDIENQDNYVNENNVENVEYHCRSLQCDDTLDKIDYYHDLIKQYENLPELNNTDMTKLNKIDAVRKNLMWDLWKSEA